MAANYAREKACIIIYHQHQAERACAKTMNINQVETNLNGEVTTVYVVTKEQVASVLGMTTDVKQLHQVVELAVDVATYCKGTTSRF
jgi:phosphopantetheine adenylyltransferase